MPLIQNQLLKPLRSTLDMKTTVTLTDENAAGLALAVELTGLSLDEIVNNLLADELTCFRPDDDWNEYVENTLGCWKFKDQQEPTWPTGGKRWIRILQAGVTNEW
jgi:hypothetical protein